MTQVAIQLPDELSQFVDKAVQAGDFPNADDFFISIVSMYKEQVETQLSEPDKAKIASLRTDIQIAVDQADRGEVIRDFNIANFLDECHREHEAVKSA